MNAFILAAGLGTRLRPWTLSHPKALVPVGGQPMLGRVLDNLLKRGFDTLTVNIHHFGNQIIDFVEKEYADTGIAVSDERDLLRDTGGALRHAASLLRRSDISGGVLVHNVDILSDAPLEELMRQHRESGADMTLMVSSRPSTRVLLWDEENRLRGWMNLSTGETRLRRISSAITQEVADISSTGADIIPARGDNASTVTDSGENSETSADLRHLAFSGIYVVGPRVFSTLESEYSANTPFSIIDFMLEKAQDLDIRAAFIETPDLIDIGKPDTLHKANLSFITEES